MITTDALKYLPQMGLDPSCVVGCAGTKCQNSFALPKVGQERSARLN